MSTVHLIPVALGGQYIEVHPTTLAAHEAAGWRPCEKRDIEEQDGRTPVTREALDATLATLPGDQTDPDYVVSSMRGYFGDLFTPDDEARVRDLVKPESKKPSDGLTVEELKAALTEKGIDFPSTALKADLQALLDAPTQPNE